MVKKWKIITQNPKTTENPDIFDINSITIIHPNTSRYFFKTIRHDDKVSEVGVAERNPSNALYSDTTKSWNYLDETKNIKKQK